jgi:RNA-directed DNA polymerase
VSKIVKFLAQATGLRPQDILAIIHQAPVSYKRYAIPKRTGGQRLIAQPAKEVKKLQRLLAMRLSALPIHEAATAYVRGRSIKDNAERHASNGPIMKFDFKEFFPSIRDRDWRAYCVKMGVFSEAEDVYLSSKLFFTRAPGSTILRLAIGAPSSPWLSNVLMYEFDKLISDQMAKDKVVYSRYADDLTFSAPRTGFLNHVERSLRIAVKNNQNPKLTINEEKTVLSTSKYRRVVTGLVLANDGRVTIGRERKRNIRAALHQAFLGKLDAEESGRLAGLIAYVKGVEPTYFEELTLRYGADLIEKLGSPLAGRP